MTHTTQAIVLKKISAGEADVVVVLYTHDFGKIRAYAQGVKKENAKLKGHVESMSLSTVQFVLGAAGERLTYAQMMQSWPSIRNDFDRYGVAVYIVELIDRHCLVGQRDDAIWELLFGSLVELEQCNSSEMRALVEVFERDLLTCLGYAGIQDMRTLGIPLARPFTMVYNEN